MHLVKTQFIKDNQVILLDCRFKMSAPSEGPAAYQSNHLAGAYYVHLECDMTSAIKEHGGRHPLPDLENFTKLIGSFGIKKTSKVVIYDDGDLAMASRLWFMLKLIGLKNVFILEGGYAQIIKEQMPLTDEMPKKVQGNLELDYQKQLICHMEDIRAAIKDDQTVIVDSRSNPRFLGLEEPYDKIAGHIPTAVNYFWQDIFNEGHVKNYGNLEAMFLEMGHFDNIIVHCGSGITGCVNMFFLNEIGISSKLYLGSYSDWVSYDDNEIVVKNNKTQKVNQ